ncbi:hypothetical protein [uncultured Draconibacterium sp.]|uniref:hypothetical protein n=1 Tax=uncultured Draconibacterium sp. TaxID=1573823 RepID=UPI003216EAF4
MANKNNTRTEINKGPGVIRTYTGLYLNVLNPDPELICIEDIAHALSSLCRFGGHTGVFYSVAEHSVRCKLMAQEQFKYGCTESHQQKADEMMAALMHDASEAYLVDVPRPVKELLPRYYEIENNLMQVIAKKFGFTLPLSERVTNIDNIMLQREWDNLMLGVHWQVLSRDAARSMFLKEFDAIEMFREYELKQL